MEEAAEKTCGEEVATSAEGPEAWRDLMRHVAINLEAHAAWVGSGSPAAREEHDGLRGVAAAYLEMAAAADRACAVMRAMRGVPAAPHDPARRDGAAFVAWMRRKVELQRALASMLERHAAESERALGVSNNP
jgi:hypothetical protein